MSTKPYERVDLELVTVKRDPLDQTMLLASVSEKRWFRRFPWIFRRVEITSRQYVGRGDEWRELSTGVACKPLMVEWLIDHVSAFIRLTRGATVQPSPRDR